ncbi:MAG: hypothetical protein O2971_03020 [Proteobacteria bacterium]|nr:hypothetical protein [Pseudomonadota bacterium]
MLVITQLTNCQNRNYRLIKCHQYRLTTLFLAADSEEAGKYNIEIPSIPTSLRRCARPRKLAIQ